MLLSMSLLVATAVMPMNGAQASQVPVQVAKAKGKAKLFADLRLGATKAETEKALSRFVADEVTTTKFFGEKVASALKETRARMWLLKVGDDVFRIEPRFEKSKLTSIRLRFLLAPDATEDLGEQRALDAYLDVRTGLHAKYGEPTRIGGVPAGFAGTLFIWRPGGAVVSLRWWKVEESEAAQIELLYERPRLQDAL